jgi:hypothetical protein
LTLSTTLCRGVRRPKRSCHSARLLRLLRLRGAYPSLGSQTSAEARTASPSLPPTTRTRLSRSAAAEWPARPSPSEPAGPKDAEAGVQPYLRRAKGLHLLERRTAAEVSVALNPARFDRVAAATEDASWRPAWGWRLARRPAATAESHRRGNAGLALTASSRSRSPSFDQHRHMPPTPYEDLS